jgi:hypothetical protein
MSTPVPYAWPRELAYRMRRHLLLKLVGTTAWVWAFFIGYFHLLHHVAFPMTVIPLTPLDSLVPAWPVALIPYLSLWVYVGIGPGLQRTFRELLAYGVWSALLCAIGLALFYRWPTQIPAFVFDTAGFPGFSLLQGIDSAGNACPSMHVAFAAFTAIWIDVLLRDCRAPTALRVVNVLWFAAITWSTLAIRQHVVIDAVAGAVLGVAVAIPSLVWRPAGRRPSDRGDAAAIMRGRPGRDGATVAVEEPTAGSATRGRDEEEMMGVAR